MRNIILLLCLILLSGCVTSPSDLFTGGAGSVECMKTGYLSVTSTPSDAEIYINDKLVGRTPVADLPFVFKGSRWRQPYGLGYAEEYGFNENYTLKVSKSGYKDAVQVMEDNPDHKYTYNFDLEQNPQVSSMSASGEISKATEIEKYKELLDKGAITKEEFEQKKKQLLGF